MQMEINLEVALVRKTDWQQLVGVLAESNERTQRLAGAILTSLHDRHIGITPALALNLARSLLAGPSQVPAEPWNSVQNRLRQTLLDLAEINRAEAERLPTEAMPLRLGASFGYTVLRVANYLVQAACRNLGRSILFCEDDDLPGVGLEEYHQYARALSEEVLALTRTGSKTVPDLFWQEAALALGGLARTRERQQSEYENRALPVMNAPDLGLFLRLEPEIKDTHELPSRDLLPYRQPDIMARYQFDAGTDAIHVTRNLDELHRRLVSESLYPEAIQLDHLLNTGFLATRRPPKPIRMRDVLIVGILPGELHETETGLFARTCWFELLLRLGPMLQRSGLERSELRWIEGNTSHGHLVQSLLVKDLPDILLESADPRNRKLRQRLRLGSGWLPAYLDRHAFFLPSNRNQVANLRRFPDPLQDWLYSVWRGQKDNHTWQQYEERGYRRTDPLATPIAPVFREQELDTSKYAYVHLALLLPARCLDNDQPEHNQSPGYWRSFFNLQSQRSSLSLTAVPPHLRDIDEPEHKRQWRFLSNWHPEERLLTGYTPTLVRDLASKLVSQWIQTIVKDLSYG